MKEKNSTVLLLDFSNLFYRGLYVHANLTHKGKPTGGLFGFVIQLAKLVSEFRPTKLLICGDSQPYLRTLEYPEYKARRKKKDPEVWKATQHNLKLCNEFFELLGHPLQKIKGLEADDLIAMYASEHERDYEKIIAVSSDTDLYQLMDQHNLYLYLGTAENRRMVDYKAFFKKYPFRRATTWVKVVAYTGGHNGLPGVRGVGEITAIKLLTSTNSKWIRKRREIKQEYGKQLKLTERLASLPFPGINCEDFSIDPVQEYDHKGMNRFLHGLGIDFTVSMESAFDYLNELEG